MEDYVRAFKELRWIFDILPTGILFIVDERSHIAAANSAASDFFGDTGDALVGRSIRDLARSRLPDFEKVYGQVVDTGKSVRNFTMSAQVGEAETRPYLVTVAPAEEQASNRTFVVLMHDISEVTELRRSKETRDHLGPLIGGSPAMRRLYEQIEKVAPHPSSVLIEGETGVGKELIARSIHGLSPRKDKPFVPVNCSALHAELLESELFGYEKGAFTGANQTREGRFEIANGGTLFLDEIATLDEAVQVTLLRVLQEREIERVGSAERIPVDVRVIAASNEDLNALVDAGDFRQDLLFRVKVVSIHAPPLRERLEDIPMLANSMIAQLNDRSSQTVVGLAPDAIDSLQGYSWPGNVRELQNAIESAFVLSDGALLRAHDFPEEIRRPEDQPTSPSSRAAPDEYDEAQQIREALRISKGSRQAAADRMNIHRTSLWRKMREYGIPNDYGKQS